MVLGERGRILKEVRERATQILIEKIQRPVVLAVEVTQRRNRIEHQNEFDSFQKV
jgi:GTPase Era involved in 16S rRNA processing